MFGGQLELARADLVPGQLPGHRRAPALRQGLGDDVTHRVPVRSGRRRTLRRDHDRPRASASSRSSSRRGRPRPVFGGQGALSARPRVARRAAVPRVLPRRQRRRARRVAPDRLDRARRRPHRPPVAVPAARHDASGATVEGDGVRLRGVQRASPSRRALPLRRGRSRDSASRSSAATATSGGRSRRARATGCATATASTGRGAATRPSSCWTRTRARSRARSRGTPPSPHTTTRLGAVRAPLGRARRAVRLGRRPPPADAAGGLGRLRAARQGLHEAAS